MANPNNSPKGVAVAGVPKPKKQLGGGKSNLSFHRAGNPNNNSAGAGPGKLGAPGISGPVGSARDKDAPAGGGASNMGDMTRARVKAPGADGLASSGGKVSRGPVRHPSTPGGFHALGHNMDVRKGK